MFSYVKFTTIFHQLALTIPYEILLQYLSCFSIPVPQLKVCPKVFQTLTEIKL